MQSKETRGDWDHRDPEEHKVVEPQRCAIGAVKRDNKIVVVGPQDSNHDKAQRVYRQQAGELPERHSIISEGKAIRNADFKNYNGDGDREDTVRKAFNPSVAWLK